MSTVLSFYDHHRQAYADVVPLRDGAAAEFMIGEYRDGGGAGPLGEFRITLHHLPVSSSDRTLTAQVQVFADGFGAFREILALGILDAIEHTTITHRNDVVQILLDAGLTDRSAVPLTSTES